MLEVLWAGGPVMIPIGLCSLIGLTTFIERMWSLRRSAVIPDGVTRELQELARQGRWDDVLTRCRTAQAPVARLVEAVVMHRESEHAILREHVEEVGRREAAGLERYMPVLGTVASVAPLLGLLGTVGGMIVTFQVIEAQGVQDVSDLAGGISQALITTFAGLCVGIPALIANRYLLARVDAYLLDLEACASAVAQYLDDQVGPE